MVKKENKSLKIKDKAGTPEKNYKNVKFTFYSPESMNVYVSGEFNGWDTQSLPVKKHKEGVWRAKVKLLPGRYEYNLFADNAWLENLPDAETISDSFGTQNFVFSVK